MFELFLGFLFILYKKPDKSFNFLLLQIAFFITNCVVTLQQETFSLTKRQYFLFMASLLTIQ